MYYIPSQMLGTSTTPLQDDHDEKFGVPSLEELGFDCESLKPPVWHGGEMEALSRLERHLERKAWVASFGLPKMTPQSLLASQTGLSPYLRFGCLSTRLFYHALSDLYRKIKKCEPPLSLHGQVSSFRDLKLSSDILFFSCCGGSFSTVPRPKTQISIR